MKAKATSAHAIMVTNQFLSRDMFPANRDVTNINAQARDSLCSKSSVLVVGIFLIVFSSTTLEVTGKRKD